MASTTQEKAVERGKLLVGAVQAREVKRDEYLWELADLSAEMTHLGRPKVSGGHETFSQQVWAEVIGWIERGYTLSYMKNIVAEARAWPEEYRVPGKTLGQHHDARDAHQGDVKKASKWLAAHSDGNVRDSSRTISEITGSGPVYEARLTLYRARRLIVSVPAKLAKSDILGNEPNFDQFQRELERLRRAIEYVENYVGREMVVDKAALDEALDRILSGEEAA